MLAIAVNEGSRLSTVSVGDTWKRVEPPRFPTTIELVVVGMGCSFSFPPTAMGILWPAVSLVIYQPRTEVPAMAWKTQWGERTAGATGRETHTKIRNTDKTHTQRLKRLCLPLVFTNQGL